MRSERQAIGFLYRVSVRVRESAGTAATLVAVDLTFLNGANTIVTSRADRPLGDTANLCPANGTVDTRELEVIDADASHAYATTVQVRVTFTDASSMASTASGAGDVPPLPTPPPQTFVLTGVITDRDTHTGITGARMEVLNGPNAGNTATTDGTGTYTLRNLVADTFRLRASANGYDAGEQGVTVPNNPRADFELRRPPPNYAGIWEGVFEITSCQNLDVPGLTQLFLCQLARPSNGYRFTLVQSGTSISGTYRLTTGMFSCPCGGEYGTFDVTGTISPDGTLVMRSVGVARGSGVTADLTFTLRQSAASALGGTIAGKFRLGSGEDRSTFSGVLTSGNRVQ